VPTDARESDGTLEWDSTTIIVVNLRAGNVKGLGYTYGHASSAGLVRDELFPLVKGGDPLNIGQHWEIMNRSVRNVGRNGIASSAIAALEMALWDLKGKLLGVSLVRLLGAVREKIPVYGSGGFTSYTKKQLCRQFEDWAAAGISMMKMKIGREPDRDAMRVQWARQAVGEKVELFVDANGAYTMKQALAVAEKLAAKNVRWFEEPVSSDDLRGLRELQQRAPAEMETAAGEYNYDLFQARRMLETGAVDVLQADATRCGVTGFLQMASLCEAFQIPLSAHTAPAVHAHLGCVAGRARHVEYFHDHARIEQMFFEGATTRQQNGFLRPDPAAPGLGLEFKAAAAAKFEI